MPFGEALTVHSRTVTSQDTYGNDVYASADTAAYGAFAPVGSVEVVQGQDTVTTTPTVYIRDTSSLPALKAVDQVTIRGVLYNVTGDSAIWVSPYAGDTAGWVLRLQGVTG